MSRIQELGLRDNIWNFFQYQNNKSFNGWPIKNTSNAENVWETTTFQFWDIIEDVSLYISNSENWSVMNTSFRLENINDWLYAKVG